MSENMTTLLIALIAASPAYVKIIADIKNRDNKEEKAIKTLMKIKAKKDLTDLMINACERGYTYKEEVELTELLYEPYRLLGWNGQLDELHERYTRLQIQKI